MVYRRRLVCHVQVQSEIIERRITSALPRQEIQLNTREHNLMGSLERLNRIVGEICESMRNDDEDTA